MTQQLKVHPLTVSALIKLKLQRQDIIRSKATNIEEKCTGLKAFGLSFFVNTT